MDNEGGGHPKQACVDSGDFFTVGKGFTDKKVLENMSMTIKKFIFR